MRFERLVRLEIMLSCARRSKGDGRCVFLSCLLTYKTRRETDWMDAKSGGKSYSQGKREISQSKKVRLRARHYLDYKEVDKARPVRGWKISRPSLIIKDVINGLARAVLRVLPDDTERERERERERTVPRVPSSYVSLRSRRDSSRYILRGAANFAREYYKTEFANTAGR